MSTAGSDPQGARSRNSHVVVSSNPPRANFWIRELPYILVFILTILGVAYTTYMARPVMGYWAILAPVIAVVCVGAGWRNASSRKARTRLIWTQALHWAAFLMAMSVMFLPNVQRILNANATGLAILALLALGTFTAGLHVPSWQVCVLGLLMALGVPATAWIEESALIYVLITVTALAIGAVLWWHFHEARSRRADRSARVG
jgi:hypothetical protein